MKKKNKGKPDHRQEILLPQAARWEESFDGADHQDFIKMSAQAMQEAMNIASASGDVERMIQVAGQWGTLAATMKQLQEKNFTFGFTDGDDDD